MTIKLRVIDEIKSLPQMFKIKIVSRMMVAVIMTRNKNVSGKGKSKV